MTSTHLVSAFLKAAHGKPYAFLFESVTGGEQRGRYSFFGFDPDIIWRSLGLTSEISRNGEEFENCSGRPLDTLRQLQTETSFDLPDDIPPMAAGLFGYLGYDMVRQVETLSNICLLYTSPSPRDLSTSRMPSSA